MSQRSFLFSIILIIFALALTGCPDSHIIEPSSPLYLDLDLDSERLPRSIPSDGIVARGEGEHKGWHIKVMGGLYKMYDPLIGKYYDTQVNNDGTVSMTDTARAQREGDYVEWKKGKKTGEPGVEVEGGGGTNCFAPDTQVLMADGSMKRIIEVKQNEMVKAYDETAKKVVNRKVTLAENGLHEYYFEINNALKATPPHPFFTMNRGWVALENLKVGDRIKSHNGETKIVSFKKIKKDLKIYNIRVEEFENFFVSGNGKDFFLVK